MKTQTQKITKERKQALLSTLQITEALTRELSMDLTDEEFKELKRGLCEELETALVTSDSWGFGRTNYLVGRNLDRLRNLSQPAFKLSEQNGFERTIETMAYALEKEQKRLLREDI